MVADERDFQSACGTGDINMIKAETDKPAAKPGGSTWNHKTPVTFPVLFDWPPKPGPALFFLIKRWITISRNVLFLFMATLVYVLLMPEMARFVDLAPSWILAIFFRNVALMVLIAGGLHLYLYTFRAQANKLKYDAREQMETSKRYTFNSQLLDNMFWSLGSGCLVWTAYEVLYLWGAANGVIPTLGFESHPLAFALWLLVLPNILSLHFYLVHRLLHWPPLYNVAHKLHHRNTLIGPWSGMSMHPIEHVLYISSVLIHFVIPSHPVIFLLHLYTRCLAPAFSHSGFEKILFKDTKVIDSADFHHQLHHRFFECNYGNPDAPWDKWLGSLHDGSDEATAAVKKRRAAMYRNRKSLTAG